MTQPLVLQADGCISTELYVWPVGAKSAPGCDGSTASPRPLPRSKDACHRSWIPACCDLPAPAFEVGAPQLKWLLMKGCRKRRAEKRRFSRGVRGTQQMFPLSSLSSLQPWQHGWTQPEGTSRASTALSSAYWGVSLHTWLCLSWCWNVWKALFVLLTGVIRRYSLWSVSDCDFLDFGWGIVRLICNL